VRVGIRDATGPTATLLLFGLPVVAVAWIMRRAVGLANRRERG
jgi:hypothetical protein